MGLNHWDKSAMWVIDFEASGLSRLSYPIEVGLTNGCTDYQALIKPMRHWNYWSDEAESVHKISRTQIQRKGIEPAQVAQELNHRLSGKVAYCDSVQWDGFWCNILYADNAIHCKFEIRDISELITDSDEKLSTFLAERAKLEQSGQVTLHRALDDAKIIRTALQAIEFP